MPVTLPQADVESLCDLLAAAFPSVELLVANLPEPLRNWRNGDVAASIEKKAFATLLVGFVQANEGFDTFLPHIYARTNHPGLSGFIAAQPFFQNQFSATLLKALRKLAPLKAPFVNREILRGRLAEFLDLGRGSQRLLVIPPSAAAGKSHSRFLMRHVAKALDFPFVYVDCLKVREGLEAAQFIANELGLDTAPLEAQLRGQSQRPGLTFKSWLKGKLQSGGPSRRGWIAFDHVNKPKSTDAVESIALELARAAAEGEFESLLVTLIDSDFQSPPSAFGEPTDLRDVPVAPLSRADLASYYARWLQALGRPEPPDMQGQVDALVADLANPPDAPAMAQMLARLGKQLTANNLLPKQEEQWP